MRKIAKNFETFFAAVKWIPESCMKINATFRLPLIAARQANDRITEKYRIGIMRENLFFVLILELWAIRRLPSVRRRRIIQGEA